MNIAPNRQALKVLAEFNVDSQFCHKYGNLVFNYAGEMTDQYKEICEDLLGVLTDIKNNIDKIKEQLPVNTHHTYHNNID